MPLIRALLISFAVHILITWSMDYLPQTWKTAQKKNTVLVELVESRPEPAGQKQIVRESTPPPVQLDEKNSEEARFLSAQKQRVQLETRAQKTGLTQNRQQNILAQQELAKKNHQAQKKLEKDPYAAYQPIDLQKELRQNEIGTSTVGESLPRDVSVGSFTALNTDQFQYYSFYSRVEELVRFRWETRVKDAIQFFDRRNMIRQIGNKNWISKMTFLLSPDGKLQKVLMMQESGVQAFDQAAVMSFKEVLQFPNPPKDLIQEDGYIHLKYSFNVHFDPQYVAY